MFQEQLLRKSPTWPPGHMGAKYNQIPRAEVRQPVLNLSKEAFLKYFNSGLMYIAIFPGTILL